MAAARAKSSRARPPSGDAAAPSPPPPPPPAQPPVDDLAVIEAALRLAVRDGWRRVGLAAIAGEAGIGLADLYARFPDKGAIVAGLMAVADRAMLAGETGDTGGSPRDRLFDVVMRRFDALQPHRAGIAAIVAGGPDPVAALQAVRPMARSLTWMLESAGIDTTGLAGRLRLAGLGVVYARAFRAWLADDGADLGKTMAALDQALARAEGWAGSLPHLFRRPG